MAIDTQQKRMSAINPSCPWRGGMVEASASFPVGKRQAAAYLYSGISSGEIVAADALRSSSNVGIGCSLGALVAAGINSWRMS